MKKVIILLISTLVAFNFVGCEADAKPSDFLSEEDLESLLDIVISDEDLAEGLLEEPVFIADINGEAYVAVSQIAYLSGNNLLIVFNNDEGDELRFALDNPASITYTAQANSLDLFVAQYTVGDGDQIFTTTNSTGVLELIFAGDIVSSSAVNFFNFIALDASNTANSIEVDLGRFTDVIVLDR